MFPKLKSFPYSRAKLRLKNNNKGNPLDGVSQRRGVGPSVGTGRGSEEGTGRVAPAGGGRVTSPAERPQQHLSSSPPLAASRRCQRRFSPSLSASRCLTDGAAALTASGRTRGCGVRGEGRRRLKGRGEREVRRQQGNLREAPTCPPSCLNSGTGRMRGGNGSGAGGDGTAAGGARARLGRNHSHGIGEVGTDPRDHPSQRVTEHHRDNQTRPLSATPSLSLNTSRADTTTSLGSLLQCLITPSVKKLFLTPNLNLPWRSLRLCSLVLLLVAWEKRPTPGWLQPHFSGRRESGPDSTQKVERSTIPLLGNLENSQR
ncbi:uncharacterized protein LOC113459733 [Zonotrichia albicollis]|uniref:uncharacterized protein LOC113459733 n=1 Tax=Zonotrichia albicollis TaxID=44394 RepID=UPI003D80D6D0